jgi:uncharacterized membrane protein
MLTTELVGWAPHVVEVAGIVIIVGGLVYATALFVWRARPAIRSRDAYRLYRQDVGSAILLGLEFLVAADIIRSVGISPTFESIGVLAGIVLIRTFLSFTLELEIEGRWPWQRGGSPPNAA